MELVPDGLRGVSRVVFAGRFGSGKTEIAINFALHWQRCTHEDDSVTRTTLIDLDIVTPYFRSREVADRMHAQGIDIVSPASVSQHLDVPGITPEILGLLQAEDHRVVLDVGGDEQGARALAQYSGVLRRLGYVTYFVVNPYRPFTQDTEGIRSAISDIERTSRLLVTGIVSNPNMMSDTLPGDFARGQQIVELASRQLSLPIAFVAVERCFLTEVEALMPAHLPILPLERFFMLPWGP